MATVYLETSFVSACITERGDPASLYRRQASLEWWNGPRLRHVLFVSAEVLSELSHPSFMLGAKALELIREIPILPITEQVRTVARTLVSERVMPGPIAGDAVHVAVAIVNELDYVRTWNVRHLANPNKLDHLREVCRRIGVVAPALLTPEMLWETDT
jgi:hypothetical protein